jgi:hypothetical protein
LYYTALHLTETKCTSLFCTELLDTIGHCTKNYQEFIS